MSPLFLWPVPARISHERMLCCCLRIVHELATSGGLWRHLRHPVMMKHIRDMLLPTDDAPNKQDPLVSVGDETENDSKRF